MKPIKKQNIVNYSSPLTNNGIYRVADYIKDKFENIHVQLYEDALDKFIEKEAKKLDITPTEYKRIHTILEYRANDYFKPSQILVISKKKPYTKNTYSLEDYWNRYYYDNRVYVDEIVDKENKEEILNYEITNINYIKGIATLESKISGDVIEVPIETLTNYIPISDEMSLTNTFASKI